MCVCVSVSDGNLKFRKRVMRNGNGLYKGGTSTDL